MRIVPYQQQVSVGMTGMPRASTPALVDPTGQALVQLGAQVQKLGAEMYDAQRTADLHDRVGKFTAEISSLELGFERDQDFRTAPDRFKEQADELRDKYLDGVTDQSVATAFKRQAQQTTLAKFINVQKGAWAKERDYNVSSLDANLETYATAAANAKNPGEALLVEQQAHLAIAAMQTKGWISAEDAGKRARGFLQKRDSATVIRDMSIDPVMTATKLSADPAYAANIDPVQRERWMDQAFRRAETDQRQRDVAAEKERKRIGDEKYKEALKLASEGLLTSTHIEAARPFVEPSEYKSLLDIASGKEKKDDPVAFAEVQGLIYTNPEMAERRAFTLHRQGMLRNETLSSVLSRAREVGRQEGPRSPFERERQFLVNALKPPEGATDPAPFARQAIAVREFDDYAIANPKATPEQLREEANGIAKRTAMIDMVALARQTGAGSKQTPEAQIEAILKQAEKLMVDRETKRITEDRFKSEMEKLNKARQAAERAASFDAGK